MDYEFFMKRALDEAQQALSLGEFPVGCVVVYGDHVLVTGARKHSGTDSQNELDHAEMAAIRRLISLEKKIDRRKLILFSTLEPCLMCYAAILLNGIRQIVYAYEDVMGGGTNLELKKVNPFYKAMEIKVVPHILREESLMLFRDFFSDPSNDYLKGTLLAEYTLKQ